MVILDRHQAMLFRLLVAFFGEDRVIPHMSVQAVCGGEVASKLPPALSVKIQEHCQRSATEWARKNKCLFTIVNRLDSPRLVIEFFEDFSQVVDLQELNRRRFMEPVLSAAGVPYVTMSIDELEDIVDPEIDYGLADFLQARLDLPDQAAAE